MSSDLNSMPKSAERLLNEENIREYFYHIAVLLGQEIECLEKQDKFIEDKLLQDILEIKTWAASKCEVQCLKEVLCQYVKNMETVKYKFEEICEQFNLGLTPLSNFVLLKKTVDDMSLSLCDNASQSRLDMVTANFQRLNDKIDRLQDEVRIVNNDIERMPNNTLYQKLQSENILLHRKISILLCEIKKCEADISILQNDMSILNQKIHNVQKGAHLLENKWNHVQNSFVDNTMNDNDSVECFANYSQTLNSMPKVTCYDILSKEFASDV